MENTEKRTYNNKSKDYAAILDAYRRYPEVAKAKVVPQAFEKKLAVRNDLQNRAIKVYHQLAGNVATMSECSKLVNKGKVVYRQYVEYSISAPEIVDQSIQNDVDRLLRIMACWESEFVRQFRFNEHDGGRIDLIKILDDEANVRQLLSHTIHWVMERALSDTEYTIVTEEDRNIYITNTGKKYHIAGCRYCMGRRLMAVSINKIENMGYAPCRCVTNLINDKGTKTAAVSGKNAIRAIAGRHSCMTAFIDESIRDNPAKNWDYKAGNKQASYSYVICRGFLNSEKEINCANICMKNACLFTDTSSPNRTAIEAISTVLFKLAYNNNFHDDVIIYTDNDAAKDRWYLNITNQYLAKQFKSVVVKAINREDNTVADAIGRERAFIDVPASVMKKIIWQCNEYNELKKKVAGLEKELDDIKQLFDEKRQSEQAGRKARSTSFADMVSD
ncbi:MAG: hypothetical protein IJ661_03830 [Lachnospiraceae bacterium]|nr:hypothetical protein [Lachnospiraceae bacterium]